MSETENEKNVSLGLRSLPSGTFEHDVAVSDRYEKFSSEILRLSLAGIGAIGFIVSMSKGRNEATGWMIVSLLAFATSAGLSLLHLYFSADSKAYHLKYLRLENSLGDVSKIDGIKECNRFEDCIFLYISGDVYRSDDEQIEYKKAANERDARNFLFRVCRKLLLFSGIFLWIGAIALVLSFLPSMPSSRY